MAHIMATEMVFARNADAGLAQEAAVVLAGT